MRIRSVWAFILCSLLIAGCAGRAHTIGYDITKNTLPVTALGEISILPFDDERPKEEHKGLSGKLLTFSSKDAHFDKKVAQAIEEILNQELANVGFSITEGEPCDYKISGSVKHFQAIIAPAKITFLPYLGPLSTLWAKDDFTIALSIYIKMADQRKQTLIDKVFDVSEDMELPTGLLNLARYSRGFNYKLKLLDEALRDVIRQIRDEVVAKVKNET